MARNTNLIVPEFFGALHKYDGIIFILVGSIVIGALAALPFYIGFSI